MKANLCQSEQISEKRKYWLDEMESTQKEFQKGQKVADDQLKKIRELEKQLSEAEKQMRREQTRNKETTDRLYREKTDATHLLANCKSELDESMTRLKECKEKAKNEVNMKQAECVEFQSQLLELQRQNEDIKHHYERERLEVSDILRKEKEEELQRLYTEIELEDNQHIRELREKLHESEQRWVTLIETRRQKLTS